MPNLGGLTFLDSDTILIGSAANGATGTIQAIDVIRDAGNHITGFAAPSTFFAEAPYNDGGIVFGPVVRDHGHSLPKKVRKLALKSALSAKQADGKLVILDEVKLSDGKTKGLVEKLGKLGLSNALIVGGKDIDVNFARAAQNIAMIDVLPTQGANVYDILRRDTLVLTREAVETLEARLK